MPRTPIRYPPLMSETHTGTGGATGSILPVRRLKQQEPFTWQWYPECSHSEYLEYFKKYAFQWRGYINHELENPDVDDLHKALRLGVFGHVEEIDELLRNSTTHGLSLYALLGAAFAEVVKLSKSVFPLAFRSGFWGIGFRVWV